MISNTNESEQLVRSLTEDLDEYFTLIVERYTQKLFLSARRFVGEDTAEDMVQQTMLNIYLRLAKASKTSEGLEWILQLKLEPYLFMILKNECLKHLKKPTHITVPLEEKTDDSTRVSLDSPLSILEMEMEIDSAISDFPLPHRHILHLYSTEGLESKEIALLLGMNDNNVKTIISRSRKRLKHILGYDPHTRGW
jgi:RNA polymerase sigma factor (sigma-70 family)